MFYVLFFLFFLYYSYITRAMRLCLIYDCSQVRVRAALWLPNYEHTHSLATLGEGVLQALTNLPPSSVVVEDWYWWLLI